MSEQTKTLFLEKRGYRRRRLSDAIRLLPVAGIVLFFVPLLWVIGDSSTVSTTRSMIYIFAVWIGLVIVSFMLSWRLRHYQDEREDSKTDDPAPGDV